MSMPFVVDRETGKEWIRERKRLGLDIYDEVWDGVYVMPSMPHTRHQEIVHELDAILHVVVKKEKRGQVYPGANVSDRLRNWKRNYRIPDLVVLLNGSRCVNRGSFLFGGPDFLVEVESPDDDTEAKLPFYSKIEVRELLIVHRDTRQLRLLRHDGRELVAVEPAELAGKPWLVSEVLPLAFRRIVAKKARRTEVRRTDGKVGQWTM